MFKFFFAFIQYEWSLLCFAFSGKFWKIERIAGGVALMMGFVNLSVDLPNEWASFLVEQVPLYAFGFLFFGTALVGYSVAPFVLHKRQLERINSSAEGNGLRAFIASRENFTLKEAACIKADSPITHGEVTGPAAGYLYDLKNMVLNGDILAEGVPDPFLAETLKFRLQNPNARTSPLRDDQSEALGRVEISKSELIRTGFIGEDQQLPPQKATEVKKPR